MQTPSAMSSAIASPVIGASVMPTAPCPAWCKTTTEIVGRVILLQ